MKRFHTVKQRKRETEGRFEEQLGKKKKFSKERSKNRELSGDMRGNESLARYNAECMNECRLIGIQSADSEHIMHIIIQSRPISPEFIHF